MSLRYAAWEPPRFSMQYEPPLYIDEHAQYTKMCVRRGFLNSCFNFNLKIFYKFFDICGMRGFSKIRIFINYAKLWLIKGFIKLLKNSCERKNIKRTNLNWISFQLYNLWFKRYIFCNTFKSRQFYHLFKSLQFLILL